LLIADLHLGKAAHFRKAGIPVPTTVHHDDLNRLKCLVQHYQPANLHILGDLFHSHHNEEWVQFTTFVQESPVSTVSLITGNHDILERHRYSGLVKHDHALLQEPFLFTHKPLPLTGIPDTATAPPATSAKDRHHRQGMHGQETAVYNICGHVHPAIRVPVGLKHTVRAHCFCFGQNQAILPAFGLFTGTHRIKPGKTDAIYAIVDDQIMMVKT
jgi:metallophosphoesterase superfamily enzyme